MQRVRKGSGGEGSLCLRPLEVVEDVHCYGTRSELKLLKHYLRFRL